MRTPISIAIAVIVAVLFLQAPEFVQQYAQRLGGAIDELDRVVRHFDEDARRSGYDRSGALGLMSRNQEQLVRDQATRMSETIGRLANLRAQQAAMGQPGSFTRAGAFATGYDSDLAARTWKDFQFALPVSADGVLFACTGFILGFFVSFAGAIGLGRLARAH